MTSKVLEHQDKAISTTVEDESKDSMWLDELTPRQIVTELDKYIVGQDDAKKSVAIVPVTYTHLTLPTICSV